MAGPGVNASRPASLGLGMMFKSTGSGLLGGACALALALGCVSPAGASPSGGTVAGSTRVGSAPAIPAGAQVAIQVINADPDAAHGLVITSQAAASPMPMMTARPAFPGSALWFLGNPTAAGMHAGTLAFTVATPWAYRYLCPVPGHAQEGMTGLFTVS